MIRETSIETYHQIKEEGLLKRLRWMVYECLFNYGPLTQKQVVHRLGKPLRDYGSLTTRFSELERLGVVKIVGDTTCEFSGRRVYLWDVTKDLPIKEEKKKESTRKKIERLEMDNARLKSILCGKCKTIYAEQQEFPWMTN